MCSNFSGRVISKLKDNDDDDIKKAARKVYVKWRSHFVDHMERPMIEVKCDLKTEKLRTSGRKLLTEALGPDVSFFKCYVGDVVLFRTVKPVLMVTSE